MHGGRDKTDRQHAIEKARARARVCDYAENARKRCRLPGYDYATCLELFDDDVELAKVLPGALQAAGWLGWN